MEIKTLKIKEINPAIYNPRKDLQPGDPEYDKLKKSILEFDMVEPLVWNKRTGNLVGGHQRLKILKELGIENVEVSVVDLSEAKEKALNLALNKIQGEWDLPRLKDLLEELDTGDFDIEVTGFDLKEIEDLMNQLYQPEEGLTDDDVVPEALESISRRGDLWSLGNHRLLCGDATIITDVERLMGGEKADMVFTDPPYGVDYGELVSSRSNQKKGGWNNIKGDALSDEDLQSLLSDSLDGAGATVAFVWHPPGARRFLFWNALQLNGWRIAQEIVWVKNALVFGRADYQWRHEPCLYAKKDGASPQDNRTATTVWEVAKPMSSKHPTQKPVELAEIALLNHTKLGSICYDLFGGSGSTLIACEKLGRRCYMMEIDEHYCDVIIERWQQFTGKQAVMLDDN